MVVLGWQAVGQCNGEGLYPEANLFLPCSWLAPVSHEARPCSCLAPAFHLGLFMMQLSNAFRVEKYHDISRDCVLWTMNINMNIKVNKQLSLITFYLMKMISCQNLLKTSQFHLCSLSLINLSPLCHLRWSTLINNPLDQPLRAIAAYFTIIFSQFSGRILFTDADLKIVVNHSWR